MFGKGTGGPQHYIHRQNVDLNFGYDTESLFVLVFFLIYSKNNEELYSVIILVFQPILDKNQYKSDRRVKK